MRRDTVITFCAKPKLSVAPKRLLVYLEAKINRKSPAQILRFQPLARTIEGSKRLILCTRLQTQLKTVEGNKAL